MLLSHLNKKTYTYYIYLFTYMYRNYSRSIHRFWVIGTMDKFLISFGLAKKKLIFFVFVFKTREK